MNKKRRKRLLIWGLFLVFLVLIWLLFFYIKIFTGNASISYNCMDSDGSNNFLSFGVVNLNGANYADYCEGDIVYDYYCQIDASQQTVHEAGYAISSTKPSGQIPPQKTSKDCKSYGDKYSCSNGKCTEEIKTTSVKNCSFINHPYCVEVKNCSILDKTNTYYLLMNNLNSNNDCIKILLSSVSFGEDLPLIFDLNGYTITFGNSNGTSQNGILIEGNYNLKPNLEIKNGYVKQGSGGGYECATIRGGYWSPNKEIHHLNLFTWGTNCQNIQLIGGKNISVHDNYLEQNVSLVTDRQNKAISQIGIGSQGKIGDADFSPGGYLKIYNNILRGKGQMGIVLGRSRAGSDWGNYSAGNKIQGMNVSFNNISMEGVAANPYAIIINGYEANEYGVPVVHDNYIKQKNARGIDLDGIDDLLGMKGGLVYNNYIDTKQGCLIDNRGGIFRGYSCGTHSLRIRTSDSYFRSGGEPQNPYAENSNNVFINNTIIARQQEDSLYNISGLPYGYAVRVSIRDYNQSWNLTFINNTIVAYTSSSFVGGGRDKDEISAIFLDEIIPGNNVTFIGNKFISNHRPLWAASSNNFFINNKIIKDGPVNGVYDPIVIGYYVWRTTNNVFLNQSFSNSPGFEGLVYKGGDGGNLKDIEVSWFLDVYVKENIDTPIYAASVLVQNSQGDFVTGLTDTQGFLRVNLIEFKEVCNYYPCTPVRTNYNPYSIIIGKPGYNSNTSSFSINQSMVKEFRLTKVSD